MPINLCTKPHSFKMHINFINNFYFSVKFIPHIYLSNFHVISLKYDFNVYTIPLLYWLCLVCNTIKSSHRESYLLWPTLPILMLLKSLYLCFIIIIILKWWKRMFLHTKHTLELILVLIRSTFKMYIVSV